MNDNLDKEKAHPERKMHKFLHAILSRWIIIIFLFQPATSFGSESVGLAWVNFYDGQAADYDVIEGIKVDDSGNVYLTGFITNASRDYVTYKYDQSGNLLWDSVYDGPDGQMEQPYDMTIDSEGNVYATGFSNTLDQGADFITVKYDTDGNEKWVVRYNGPADWLDIGRNMKVNENGDVFVTGFSARTSNPLGLDDAVTIKYDSEGNEKWVRRYGPDGNDEFTHTFLNFIDAEGDIISTGATGFVDETGFVMEADCLIIKYDPEGNEIWSVIYNSEDGVDSSRSMVIDDENNIYLAGQDCEYIADGCDFITIKYDPDGNEQWVRHYGVSGAADDKAYSIALDLDNNVYVTGPSNGYFYATVKYDTDGNEKWVRLLESFDPGFTGGKDITVDSQGNSYITGIYQVEPWDYGNADIATVSYDTNGDERWVKRYFLDEHSWEEGRFVTHDNDGNIYVAAVGSVYPESFDLLTLKYSPCEGCHVDTDSFCDGETDPLNPCRICDMNHNETGWTDNDGAACDDDLFCTGTGTCKKGECADFSGDPCKPGETCDEEKDLCLPAGNDDDDNDNDDSGDDDDGDSFRLDEEEGGGCCGC